MKKINLGSGPVKGENGWINIDQLQGADLNIDITQGLPFPNDSIDIIYTSHFLEHLDYEVLCRVLKECQRVLSPGCPLSVCVPDASKFIRAYMQNDYQDVPYEKDGSLKVPSFLLEENEEVYKKAIVDTGSAIDWINYIAYSNAEHKYMFDINNLLAHLKIAGFMDVVPRNFDPELDKYKGRNASIYAIGYKCSSATLNSGNKDVVF